MERSGGEEAGKEKRLGERSIGGREARQTRLTRLSRWQCRRLVTILSKQSCRRLIFNFLAAEQGSLRSTVGTIPLCAWTGQTMEGRERERKREKGREENGNRFRRIETRVYSKRVKTWQYLQTPTPVFLGDCYTRRETKLDDDIVNARRYKYIYIYKISVSVVGSCSDAADNARNEQNGRKNELGGVPSFEGASLVHFTWWYLEAGIGGRWVLR